MGDMITFKRPDGQDCPAYLATPAAGDNAPGLVVIQEWWGINDQIKKTAERFAEAGFRALAPDLFRGRVTKDANEANHLMSSLDFPQAAHQDVRGALQYLKANGKKAGVLGFCMGGALTIISAVHVKETDAGVCFYGIPPVEAADPKTITIPLMCHFGTNDEFFSNEAIDQLETALKASSSPHELFR